MTEDYHIKIITCHVCEQDKPVKGLFYNNHKVRWTPIDNQTKCDHCGEVLDYANAI